MNGRRVSTNQVAHCLAKTVVLGFELGEWRDLSSPFFIYDVLDLDLNQ